MVFCRIRWTRFGSAVKTCTLRSSANKIGLTGYLIVEKTPLNATMNNVPLNGEPCGTPFSSVNDDDKYLATLYPKMRRSDR